MILKWDIFKYYYKSLFLGPLGHRCERVSYMTAICLVLGMVTMVAGYAAG
jgi:hypothetical protein